MEERSRLARITRGVSLVLGMTVVFGGISPVWALTGGETADVEDFPWTAALLSGHGNAPNSSYFCGGALVHPSWVVTAAHCVADRAPSDFQVAFGLNRLQGDGGSGERRSVSEILIAPKYYFRDGQHDGDVALLRLVSPVTDRDPIRLLERNVSPNDAAQAIGWSEEDAGSPVSQLAVDVLDRFQAAGLTGEGFFLDGIPIYSGSDAFGLCYGDSGTPLVLRAADGTWRLMGVASYVVESCGGYAAYGNLQFHRSWLMGHVFPGFDAWRGAHNVQALWDDKDGDGLSNFLEYARVSDPSVPTPETAGVLPLLLDGTRPGLRFLHRQDAAFRVEITDDLQNWQAMPESWLLDREPASGDSGGEAEWLTVGADSALGEGGRQFFRILSEPSAAPVKPSRNTTRDFFAKGDAGALAAGGLFEKRYDVSGLLNGTTVFRVVAPFFSPRVQLIDQATREVFLEAGMEDLHTLEAPFATASNRSYELVISSIEANPTGWFTINYPEFPGFPRNLVLDRQPVQGVLDNHSDFDGNYFSKAYRIFGAFTGDTVTVQMQSDPENGGFRPFLVIQSDLGELVVQSEGEPVAETVVSFVRQPGRDYFAYATTLVPGAEGLFTLSGRRN